MGYCVLLHVVLYRYWREREQRRLRRDLAGWKWAVDWTGHGDFGLPFGGLE